MKNKNYIFTNEDCIGCNHCISVCPIPGANVAEQINHQNHIRIDTEKCILCGQCLNICSHNARNYTDDTDLFFEELNKGESISLAIDPAFFINYGTIAKGVLGYLRYLGIKKIYNASFGADISTWAHVNYFLENKNKGGILSSCSSIINYIEKFMPSQIPYLVPIQSPAFCLAIYAKKYLKDSNKIAFLSPCIAKSIEIQKNSNCGLIDYNVTFKHFFDKLKDVDFSSYFSESDVPDSGFGTISSFSGGIKENLEQFLDETSTIINKSSFLKDLNNINTLSIISEKNCKNGVILDLNNCDGSCCFGPCTEQSNYSIGNIIEQYQWTRTKFLRIKDEKYPFNQDFSKQQRIKLLQERFKDLNPKDFFRTFEENYYQPFKIPEEIINEVFLRMYKITEASKHIDCHSCGYRSCHQMAESIAIGFNSIENCVQYEKDENLKLFTYDQLTGLPNKYVLLKDLEKILQCSNCAEYAVMQINIKRFMFINQQVGFSKGNLILAEFASKAKILFNEPENEKIYLMNGNNFYIIAKKERINDLFFKLNHLELDTLKQDELTDVKNLSIRAALYNITGKETNPDDIIDRISNTYFTARSAPNTDFMVFDQTISEKVSRTLTISQQISKALLNEAFFVVFQPKVNQITRTLIGAEALIRWNNNGKVIPPGDFVQICENSGFIKRLDFYMLNQVCKKIDEWLKKGYEPVTVSVNFSKQHLTHQDVAERICNVIDFWNIPHNLIEIEFTETSFAEMKETLKNTIDVLLSKDIAVSIDDFGSGYSSLSLLQDFNFNVLKLDKSFIETIVDNIKARKVISNIITMAKNLDMKVIAEGVETEDELLILKDLNCNIIQGYIFDKPLTSEDFEKRIINKVYE